MIPQQDGRKALIEQLKNAQALTIGLGIAASGVPSRTRPLTESEADELTNVLDAAIEALSASSGSEEKPIGAMHLMYRYCGLCGHLSADHAIAENGETGCHHPTCKCHTHAAAAELADSEAYRAFKSGWMTAEEYAAEWRMRRASSETQEERPFTCVVRRAGTTDPPQDCDYPFCGCDEHATRVIATLQECGWGPNAPSSSQSAETPQPLVTCDDCLRDVPSIDKNSRCPDCAAEWLKRDREIRGLTPEERTDAK
jgi:hypothetical protein